MSLSDAQWPEIMKPAASRFLVGIFADGTTVIAAGTQANSTERRGYVDVYRRQIRRSSAPIIGQGLGGTLSHWTVFGVGEAPAPAESDGPK